jgi:hypothetical protein
MDHFVGMVTINELITLIKTLSGANKENWKEAIDEKF